MAIGGAKPKKQADFSGKTDAELEAAETSLSKMPAQKGMGGFATGVLLKAIQAERQRRAGSKPPATPPAPDASQAASEGAAAAQKASTRQRKRSAAGNAGFVRPQFGAGSITVMPILSTNSLLGG